ncbi:NUDIX hydrolase domain-like protein [Parachaetomium inaequale]|uniref:NAD(+) diphosphatase n=1 Tax=Parachaetomium inaequale TaxID=2588326 RepID=A0AAN6PIW0_9PEZI|nr:NUDIX hydrolase domain-like protein [Parachaetomium inaequale]
MSIPALPLLLPTEDSHLTQKFGRETANYFSGSPLNRLSFLRTDPVFLRFAFAHPHARFLLLNNLAPLVQASDTAHLAFASHADVAPLTGADPFARTEAEMLREYDSSVEQVMVVFLGVDEKGVLPLPSDVEGREEAFGYRDFRGAPYFAVDVTPRGKVAGAAEALIEKMTGKGFAFHDNSPRHMGLQAGQAAMYGQARALIDWNARTPFCAQCGQPTLSVHAGTKRVCPPTDKAGTADGQPPRERKPCTTRGTVSNHSFPRTDPTVIMAVLSADGTKLLLGRQRRWPQDWFSTLAGFQEPGESIEEAVRREVWEESGVRVGRVILHSSQPWPFPASLMIGAIGQALPGEGEEIYLGHDAELESAKWFPLEEVKEALVTGVSSLGGPAPEGYVEGSLRLPPQTAIANRLITAVVEGYWVQSRM